MPDFPELAVSIVAGDVVYLIVSVFLVLILEEIPPALLAGAFFDVGALWAAWLTFGAVLGLGTLGVVLDAIPDGF